MNDPTHGLRTRLEGGVIIYSNSIEIIKQTLYKKCEESFRAILLNGRFVYRLIFREVGSTIIMVICRNCSD